MRKVILFLTIVFLLNFISANCESGKVDINSASIEELDKLTGIGPAFAQDIIDARPYSSVDDLDKAKNIGPSRLKKIKEQGLACVDLENNKDESKNNIINEENINIVSQDEEESATRIKESATSEVINNYIEPTQEIVTAKITGENIIKLNSDNSLEETKSKVVYQSKTEIIRKYAIYAFAVLLIFMILILLIKG